jgi:hemerythrin-like domain-containing protein
MLRDPSLIPLSHQHHNALALCVLSRRSLAEDGSPENVAKVARRVIDRYEIELTNHFAIEEQVLFPACPPMPVITELIAEHRAMERMVEQVRSAATPELLERFFALLGAHVRREEGEFFEEVQRILPPDVLERIGAEIDRRAVRVCL